MIIFLFKSNSATNETQTAIVRALPSRIQIWYSDGTSPNEFIVHWIRAKRCTNRCKYDVGTTRTPAVSWQYCNGIDEIEFIHRREIFEFINKKIYLSEFGGNFSVISNSITIVVVNIAEFQKPIIGDLYAEVYLVYYTLVI